MADEFKVHRLNEAGLHKAEQIAEVMQIALTAIRTIVGEGAPRELALVTTKMQEAAFFAKRGVAINPANQEGYAPHHIVTDQDESWCKACGKSASEARREPQCPEWKP